MDKNNNVTQNIIRTVAIVKMKEEVMRRVKSETQRVYFIQDFRPRCRNKMRTYKRETRQNTAKIERINFTF